MALFYLDTSAIIKRHRVEKGTEILDQLLSVQPHDRFYTSFLSVLELTSAVMRLAKGGLAENAATEILARFRLDVRDRLRVWPVDDEVMRSAVQVVERHRLRSGDAIHLATAQGIFSVISGQQAVMVSSDKELLAAATASGLSTLVPEDSDSLESLARLRASER